MSGRLLFPAVLVWARGAGADIVVEPAAVDLAARPLLPPCRKSPELFALRVPVPNSTAGEEHEELMAFGGKGWAWELRNRRHKRNDVKRGVEMLGDTWIFNATSREWREISSHAGPEHRWKAGTTGVFGDHKLAMFGGCSETATKFVMDDLWVFEPESGSWRLVETINPPDKRRGHVLVANDTHIVVFGGKTWRAGNADRCLRDVWALPKSALLQGGEPAVWTRGAEFPASCRWGGTGTLLVAPDGRLLLGMFGGRFLTPGIEMHSDANGAYTYFSDLWLYDFAADAWSLAPAKGKLPQPRDHHGATTLNGDLYVYGGRTTEQRVEHAAVGDVWSYSMRAREWTLRSMDRGPEPRFMPGVATLHLGGEEVLAIFAGESLPGSTKRTTMNDLWVFSPSSGEWTELSKSNCERTPLPIRRVSPAVAKEALRREVVGLGCGAALVAVLLWLAKIVRRTVSARCFEEDRPWLATGPVAGDAAGIDFRRL